MTAITSASAGNFRRRRLQVLTILFISYVGYYFCRVTLPVALPLLQEAFQYSSTQVGWILSAYYGSYALSKLLNGFLGDRLGGKLLMLIGIAGTAACNILFGFGEELSFFVIVWGINAYFQSMGWLSMVPIMSRWFRFEETGRAMGVLSLSYQVGDFLARSLAGLLLAVFAWYLLFWIHAGVLLIIGAGIVLWLQPSPPAPGLESSTGKTQQPTPGGRFQSPEYRRAFRLMIASHWFWTVCLVYLCLSLVRYIFWGWSVGFLLDAGSGIGMAAFASALFPLLGSAGTLFTGWISDRMNARRGPVIAVMTSLMAVSIYLFSQIPASQFQWLMVALGLVGFTLYGPYSLMAGAVAIDFGSHYSSATAAGIIDAVGAAGTILTGVGMGYLIDQYGWDQAFRVVVLIAMLGAALSFSLWRLRPLERLEKPEN